MDKVSFLNFDRPCMTVMVQADNPDRIKELIDRARPRGADAFGMQFCKLRQEFRTEQIYRELFAYAAPQPVYVTNYRHHVNEAKSDEQLADEMLALAEYGATLCDIMGDCFDRQPGEFTTDPAAIERQKALIEGLHARGAEVLMSSHVMKFIPAERVLEIALAHEARGADISKIVVGADTMDQQVENLRIIRLLKRELKIPFLFLSGGESGIMRRIGGELGCCMYLCVGEYDAFSTAVQPLLDELKSVTELLR